MIIDIKIDLLLLLKENFVSIVFEKNFYMQFLIYFLIDRVYQIVIVFKSIFVMYMLSFCICIVYNYSNG